MKLAEVDMTEVSLQDTQQELLDSLLSENKDLRASVADYRAKHNRLTNDLKLSKIMLKEFEEGKGEVEAHLFQQFIPILNQKKVDLNYKKFKEQSLIN